MNSTDDADKEPQRTEIDPSTQGREGRHVQEDQLELDEQVRQADEYLEKVLKHVKVLRRRLKWRVFFLTVIGALAGVALIWGASQTRGFWSLFMDGLGTGLLVTATVSVAAYLVSGYWQTATETSNKAILWELEDMANRLIDVSVTLDSANERVLAPLEVFLMRQEAAEKIERKKLEEGKERVAKIKALLDEPPAT